MYILLLFFFFIIHAAIKICVLLLFCIPLHRLERFVYYTSDPTIISKWNIQNATQWHNVTFPKCRNSWKYDLPRYLLTTVRYSCQLNVDARFTKNGIKHKMRPSAEAIAFENRTTGRTGMYIWKKNSTGRKKTTKTNVGESERWLEYPLNNIIILYCEYCHGSWGVGRFFWLQMSSIICESISAGGDW